ncbi:MAG: thioredoxin family protein [Acidobacteria bacterium]|nr:thioredoxin family protein [Acidobacteriota bacterium]
MKNILRQVVSQILLTCLVIFVYLTPSLAQVEKSQHSEAELVSEVESIEPGQAFWVALRLKADPEWHTYWQNPGDSGLPTSIKWEMPEGFTSESIVWPYPERIEVPPLTSFGYDGEIFLLVKITPPTNLTSKSVKLTANSKWLICKELCLPAGAKVSLELPVKNESPKASKWAQAFNDTRAKHPLTSSDWQFSAANNKDQILIKVVPPPNFKSEVSKLTFFPFEGGVIEHGSPQNFKKTATDYSLEVKRASDATEPIKELKGVIVSSEAWKENAKEKALAISISVAGDISALGDIENTTTVKVTTLEQPISIWQAILFSFIGGLILNLMPCVLPVLSIKVLGFVKQAKDESTKTWHHGVVFTLGVLLSFWALGGGLMLLRAGGEKLGWGFQLQSPTFLVFLSALFFLFGLNLFGVFEMGTSLMGVGQESMNKSGLLGSFASGALATLVATPCTAPYMGSALGFAITQPIWVSMLVFSSLAIGMSAPYVLLSLSPSLLKYVPKPGAWMETFKQFMGFLMMATVVWLIRVLGLQAGIDVVVVLLLCLIIMSIGAWILGRWGSLINETRTRRIAQATMIILVATSLTYAISTARNEAVIPGKTSSIAEDGIAWQDFSPKLIEDLRAQGKPIFLDFTAAWCLSCKFNEKVTFSSQEIKDQITKLGIIPVKADWTNRDEEITKMLESFGRSGVPLYVLYNPKEKDPVVLPEVITPDIVLSAFKRLEEGSQKTVTNDSDNTTASGQK